MPAHLPRARKTLILSAALLAAIGITIVHVYVERQGNGYVGALLALDHLFDLAADGAPAIAELNVALEAT